MTDPHELARIIAVRREINEAAEKWIVNAFQRWWQDGSDPATIGRYLGFQPGRRAALAVRNRWLLEIADELPLHERAATLTRLVDDFMRRRWPAWRGREHPPNDASDVDAALFFAARSGARMDLTRHAIAKILRGH